MSEVVKLDGLVPRELDVKSSRILLDSLAVEADIEGGKHLPVEAEDAAGRERAADAGERQTVGDADEDAAGAGERGRQSGIGGGDVG